MNGNPNPTRETADGVERYCPACGVWKVEGKSNFFPRVKRRKDGALRHFWYPICRACRVEQARERGEAFKSDGIAVGKHAEDPSLWYPDTSRNPGTPIYEAPACEALRARFGF